MKYYVYWYHLSTHTDANKQGYIGITKDLVKRHNTHMWCAKSKTYNTHFANAIRKYGESGLTLDILHICEGKEEAKMLEEVYRPTKDIGWNMAPGGVIPHCAVKSPITIYHISDPNTEYYYKSTIEASEAHNISYSRLTQAALRKVNTYGYDGWAILHSSTTDKSKTVDIREILAINAAKANTGRPSVFKGKTDRWTPEQKAKIGSYHKGKTLTNEQIEATRAHHQVNHPSCRNITLKHKNDPDTLHTFHSISEASRQLDLPLSRLKSKAQRPLCVYGNDGWAIHSLG